MKGAIKGDKIIWAIIFILFIFSVLAVFSSTGSLAYMSEAGGNTSSYIIKHIVFLLIGVGIIYFIHKVPYLFFSKIAKYLLYISIGLLVITLLFGVTKNSATRWLTVPGLGIGFQTSDLAKISLILYMARLLSKNQETQLQRKEVFQPLMIISAIVCGLILPANFSTAGLLFGTSLILMYIGRVHTQYLLRTVGGLFGVVVILLLLGTVVPNVGRLSTWSNRVKNFVKGEGGDNYQAEQSKIAIATGGFLGKGPGNSTQRNFLPHPYSDFIFAIIIEEYGIFGALIVMSLYLWLLFRAGVIVKNSTGTFAAFLVIGLTLLLVFQALINMMVAVNLIPVTGQTLPFLSMGGTSIMFSSLALGIILSVSANNQHKVQFETTEQQ
jgi:cell division protein FtsW